jgi:hypothetical protein
VRIENAQAATTTPASADRKAAAGSHLGRIIPRPPSHAAAPP